MGNGGLRAEDVEKMLEEEKFMEFKKFMDKFHKEMYNAKGRKAKDDVKKEYSRKIDPVFKKYISYAEEFFETDPISRNKLAFITATKLVLFGLKMNQIRKLLNFSATINRKAQKGDDITPQLAKLMYILAYTVSRHSPASPLAEIFEKFFKKVNQENYPNVHDFIQAVVAYHKFLGGGD